MPDAVSTGRLIVLFAMGSGALVVFVLSSLAPLNHNDFMYALTPVVWAQHGALYTDVPFVQAPLSPMLNSLLVAITGDVNIALLGRVVSMLLVLLAILLPALNRAARADPLVWVLYVALCLTNLFIVSNGSEIGNYALSLLALSAAVTAIQAPGSPLLRGFAVCACAGLATSAKLYFALLCPTLFLYFLLHERAARDPLVIAACGFGFLVGFSPILFFLARDYHSFLRWNVQIYQQVFVPTRVPDFAAGVQRIGKFLAIFAVLMAIPVGFVLVAAARAWRSAGLERRRACGKLLLLLSAGVMAISPIYMFEQYLGPVAFLLLLFSAPWDSTDGKARRLYVILGCLMLGMQCIVLAQVSARSVVPDSNLGAVQLRTLQAKARQVVGKDYACERKLYSASPLFLLENGVKYPVEMAVGPFLMFLRGEALAKKGRQFDLESRLNAWNPDIAIWGYYLDSPDAAEAEVDRIVRDYAMGHNFAVTTIGQMGGRRIELGTRPGCQTQK
jgi:hypothetical protein